MASAHSSEKHHGVGHILPIWLLVGVFVALIALTILTVLSARVDLGPFNIWLALIIAGTKATLVAAVFMHLLWDRPFNALVLFGSLLFVLLFLGIALMDSGSYQSDIIPGPAPAVQR